MALLFLLSHRSFALASVYDAALAEIGQVFQRIDDENVDAAIDMIVNAQSIRLMALDEKGCK